MSMGHNPKTITSANAVLMLRCKGVYDNFVRIQGFQADNAWGFGDSNIAETKMGVDGKQSIGYTPHETQWTLYLEANSESRRVLENIRKDFNANMEVRFIDIVVDISSIGQRYSATGTLTTLTGGANGKKVLDGSVYNFNMVLDGEEEI
ncbi:TPA: phage tail fiber protein [Providencia alcalifaciens]